MKVLFAMNGTFFFWLFLCLGAHDADCEPSQICLRALVAFIPSARRGVCERSEEKVDICHKIFTFVKYLSSLFCILSK